MIKILSDKQCSWIFTIISSFSLVYGAYGAPHVQAILFSALGLTSLWVSHRDLSHIPHPTTHQFQIYLLVAIIISFLVFVYDTYRYLS